MTFVDSIIYRVFMMIRFRLSELIADKALKERRVVPLTEVAEGEDAAVASAAERLASSR